MTRVSFEELLEAFEFVSLCGDSSFACVSRETGEVFWYDDTLELDEEARPDDLDDPDKYLSVPDEHDLELGKPLALEFAAEFAPADFDRVASWFSRAGAFGRFKVLLEERGLVHRWHEFEREAAKRGLRRWCEGQGLELIEGDSAGAPA